MAEIKVPVVRNILQANERLASENRRRFDKAGIFVVNLMSSPGAGKTSLLERTIDALAGRMNIAVIEGDLQSSYDAERIQKKGVQAVQINTDGGCHLDANMIQIALDSLDLAGVDLLIIENVGNLVCPAEFNLGEHEKIMILSVTEGDDKPIKYPLMFQICSVLLVNKIDLLPYTDCDLGKIRQSARQLNPAGKVFEISCRTGEGFAPWLSWIEDKVSEHRKNRAGAAASPHAGKH
jgi:hydrogenase nickel incorporation protein HypB